MESIRNDILKEFEVVRSLNDLNELKVKYIGKKGIITLLYTKMKDIPSDEKKEYGMKINNLKTLFNDKYDERKKLLEDEELEKKLQEGEIDVTLPGTRPVVGAPNILEKIIEEVEEVFMSMG